VIHSGSCHCGAATFEVEAPADLKLTECNGSVIFARHLSRAKASIYTFDSAEAKHHYCQTCGIKSFYIPRSHPDGYSVNARCLDDKNIKSVNITPFDGKNWEDNIDVLPNSR